MKKYLVLALFLCFQNTFAQYQSNIFNKNDLYIPLKFQIG